MIKIAPSILSADFAKLGEDIGRIEAAGADWVHIDVMDGHFVPNITIGIPVVKALRKTTGLVFDVHLMIENPDQYIDGFIDAGADVVTVHAECGYHLNRTVQKIRQRGKKAAVALNPATSLGALEWILEDVDMVLLMSVNPGFGGQSYIDSVTTKISQLKEIIRQKALKTDIEVDGGITLDNVEKVAAAGANIIVSGSTIFNAPDMGSVISQLKQKAGKVWRP